MPSNIFRLISKALGNRGSPPNNCTLIIDGFFSATIVSMCLKMLLTCLSERTFPFVLRSSLWKQYVQRKLQAVVGQRTKLTTSFLKRYSLIMRSCVSITSCSLSLEAYKYPLVLSISMRSVSSSLKR